MSTVNERIAELRSRLGLTMEKFGNKIGVTKNSINAIEKGRNNPSERTLRLICAEFNVDYFWLTEGTGEPLIEMPETTLDELIIEYDLDKKDKIIMKTYINLPDEDRKAIKRFLDILVKNSQKEKDEE